jgi:hypothetical protein
MKKEVSDEYLKKVIAISEEHFKKYKNRKMTFQELDELFNFPKTL